MLISWWSHCLFLPFDVCMSRISSVTDSKQAEQQVQLIHFHCLGLCLRKFTLFTKHMMSVFVCLVCR